MTASQYSCGTCDISFDSADAQRQHAKDEWHIYRLRCRVAPPGTVVAPPGSEGQEEQQSLTGSQGGHEDIDDDEVATNDAPEFVSELCLFCANRSDSFHDNFAHMVKFHSLFVPYQESLAVHLQTLVWYLHLVIFGYRECILCGKRHRTVEAVQQHMTAKGHCRFNVDQEMQEFYDLPSEGHDGSQQVGQDSMTLPSGKILAHRSHVQALAKPRPRSASSAEPAGGPKLANDGGTAAQSMTNKDRKEQLVASQLDQLSRKDQMGLAHLPVSEQRSILAMTKKQMDQARRAERRAQAALESAGNKTLMKNFTIDVPGRRNG